MLPGDIPQKLHGTFIPLSRMEYASWKPEKCTHYPRQPWVRLKLGDGGGGSGIIRKEDTKDRYWRHFF